MTSATFRGFVAIELPKSTLESLGRTIDALRRNEQARAVRWVRPEGIHLTLHFLGETPEGQVEPMRAALGAAALRHRTFRLRLGRLGAFPSLRAARVLWVGLEGELEALSALQRDVSTALEGLGFVPERRGFSPHLTLGRVPGGNSNAAQLFGSVESPLAETSDIVVDGVSLMQSTLLPQGARYTQRFLVPLVGTRRE